MSALMFVPGNVWVITQRCFEGKPLLKDSVDRRRWLYWLFQARRRFGLSVLNYVVLPNEIKLVVMDRRRGEIRASMQMLAERMAADYARRHQGLLATKTPLWESEYQAAVLDLGGNGLKHCISDIDLSVVRAKLVAHPNLWPECGYHELQNPPNRARRVDFTTLQRLLDPVDFSRLQTQRKRWVRQAMKLIASDGVYVPHISLQSALQRKVIRRLASQPGYTQTPAHAAQPELVPKRYIT